MRTFCVVLLASLVVAPVTAFAQLMERGATGDGSLVVSKASGKLTVSGRGVIFGHVDRGTISVVDYEAYDATPPSLSGGKMKLVGRNAIPTYTGSDMRFLFPGGKYILTIEGVGIDISAVGTGKLTEVGSGLTDGTYVVDNGATRSAATSTGSVNYGKGSSTTPGGLSANGNSGKGKSGNG